ncbi:hypothetical protein GWN28_15295, partial [candidate division KSB1 bacterium]|nr:hypothetical protein [candidate division KSB1 bacterium]NIV70266.1 hypothetical protein [Phycisphaerae bacterium]NIW19696.1 hypothetical protein [candidate division KSB1 bacterium]NIW73180.1 hypothetical protein [candidate division KSB1 bacterium]
MRIGGKIAVADGVSVNFRMDAVESGENSSDATAWGFNPNSGVATQYAQRRGDVQFDKAYLQFEKAGYTVAAGQMYFRQGMTGNMLDVVGAGFSVKKGAMKFQHVKVSDRDEGNDDFAKASTTIAGGGPTVDAKESSLSGVMYTIKSGDLTLTPMATYRFVNGDGDRFGLGLDFATNFGAVGFKGAIEYF